MNPTDSVNPYSPTNVVQAVSADTPSRRMTALGYLAASFLAALIVAIVASRGRLMHWLADFDVALPAVSLVALSPLLPGILGVGFLLVVGKEFVMRNRRTVGICNLVAIALGFLAMAVYVLGAVLPLVSLMANLRG